MLLSSLLLAPAPIALAPEILQQQDVRALPGELDSFPVFNSNSPELVLSEGILLSTFPGKGKQSPEAHLNYPLDGRFDLFSHHVTRINSRNGKLPLYLGVLVHNPGDKPVKVLVLQANSYLSSSEAPFIDLPDQIENRGGRVYSGPGSRTASDVLRRKSQAGWSTSIEVPPGQSKMLMNLKMPISNSRTTWMRLYSSDKLYVASMAKFATSRDYKPTLEEWRYLLSTGDLATPRDKAPTPPKQKKADPFLYGRVAGISQGAEWKTKVTDSQSETLAIPEPGKAFSYVLNSLDRGTLGTGQIQSAPMLARYPDTAYRAHGNYGVKYKLDIPLHNNTETPQRVTLAIQTPIKEDRLSQEGLRFFNKPTGQPFFRGTVKVTYTSDRGQPKKRYLHLVQKRGQRGKPLVNLTLPPGSSRPVSLELLYPPDSTPPQVITVQTLSDSKASAR
ncbi:hypothetical protein C1752_13679 [Acaryochloris thomasi RCC1774]|uniref:DUF3370 domain-containing protein n=2 Tax=Acaryochloris TaxID=155977 RepID=A0A2W1JGR8_9CYAN|nr:DUF3370 domain-containing protein [Acaryochloris thomasi]PZD70372.1 hypothetical protein C1752_13679 [Acaryochloris thomasi RCC1774]